EAADAEFLENGRAGRGDELRIEAGRRERVTYLRFDTSDAAWAAESPTVLSLTVGTDAGRGTISIHEGVGGSWGDDDLTAATAPEPGRLLGAVTGEYSPGDVITVELPAGAVEPGITDLIVTTDGSGAADVSFVGADAEDGPRLSGTR
ncbi:MAG: hypothetical protein AAF945_13415, partial [Actinomycetota bacterium]